MSERTGELNRYTVTYAFSGYLRQEYTEAISRIRTTIEELHREEAEIAFSGATLDINEASQLITITARYEAPNKGTIGRLNCRAGLPACGQPQREDTDTTESDRVSHGRSAQLPNSKLS